MRNLTIYKIAFLLVVTVFLSIEGFCQIRVDFTAGNTLKDHGVKTWTKNVSGVPETVNKLIVEVDITHSWVNDLEMTITNPDGLSVTVFSRLGDGECFGCDGDDLVLTFSDADPMDYETLNQSCDDLPAYSGSSKAMNSLDVLLSSTNNGTWTIDVKDYWPHEKGFANVLALIFDEYSVPPCTALNDPLDASSMVAVNSTLNWNENALADGYYLSLGSEPGNYNILDGFDVGQQTSYDPGGLMCGQEYFVKITPYNDYGDAESCPEESFSTEFVVAESSGDLELCKGDTEVLNGFGGIEYEWFPYGLFNNNFLQNPTLTATSSQEIGLVVYNENGCTDTTFLYLTVLEIIVNLDSIYHARLNHPGFIDISTNNTNGSHIFKWLGPAGFYSTNEDIEGLDIGCYELTVTDTLTGCRTDTLFCIEDLTDVPLTQSNSGIELYPNPAKDYIKIHFNSLKDTFMGLILYDMTGNRIKQIHEGKVSAIMKFTLEDIPTGLYLLELRSHKLSELRKLEIFRE